MKDVESGISLQSVCADEVVLETSKLARVSQMVEASDDLAHSCSGLINAIIPMT